jgi:DNA-binding CsgD family transcriptional regulator
MPMITSARTMRNPRLTAEQQAVVRALDAVPAHLAFYGLDGALVHANQALTRLLAGSADGARLRAEIEALARRLGDEHREQPDGCENGRALAREPDLREVASGGRYYLLRGSVVCLDLFGAGDTVLVSVERPPAGTLSDAALRERFRLTGREVRIARLLGEGRTNAEIAERLYISPHTVRTHTERVLRKLGIRSRAEVGAKLRYE